MGLGWSGVLGLRGVRRFWKSLERLFGWCSLWISLIGISLELRVRLVGWRFRSSVLDWSSLAKLERGVFSIVGNLDVSGMLKILNFFGSIRCLGIGSWVFSCEVLCPGPECWLSMVGKVWGMCMYAAEPVGKALENGFLPDRILLVRVLVWIVMKI